MLTVGIIIMAIGFILMAISHTKFVVRFLTRKKIFDGKSKPLVITGIVTFIIGLAIVLTFYPY